MRVCSYGCYKLKDQTKNNTKTHLNKTTRFYTLQFSVCHLSVLNKCLQFNRVLWWITSSLNRNPRLSDLNFLFGKMTMEGDHIAMSFACICMAIKRGSTSMYMCKTHFPEQQDQGVRRKVTKMQSVFQNTETRTKKLLWKRLGLFSVFKSCASPSQYKVQYKSIFKYFIYLFIFFFKKA